MRVLAISVLILAGCGDALILGDSNTCPRLAGCLVNPDGWPAQLAPPNGWSIVNGGRFGMTAGDYHDDALLGDGLSGAGPWRLDQLLASHPAPWPCLVPRKLVIALGTNDLVEPHATAVGIGMAVLALYDRARREPCTDVYVATITPRTTAPVGLAAHANSAIAVRVPADHLIPFGAEPTSDLGPDGTHVTAAAQVTRAAMAGRILFP